VEQSRYSMRSLTYDPNLRFKFQKGSQLALLIFAFTLTASRTKENRLQIRKTLKKID
jgi:hypothetical protein